MLRHAITALFFSAAAAAAQDSAGIARVLSEDGLAAAAEQLSGADTPQDRFALGGVLFLRAIEKTLQTRWRHGLQASSRMMMPVLRLPVPDNPSPEPFRPEMIAGIFSTLIDDLAAARAALSGIGDDDQVALILPLREIWFDIDGDGARGTGEGLLQVAGWVLTQRMAAGRSDPVIRFDTADAAWLVAYTHLLSALAEGVLAFDPTDQIIRVQQAARDLDAIAADTNYASGFDMIFGAQVDMAAIAFYALQQQPDAAHTRAARAHLLAMIRNSRLFWTRAEAETDNAAEWIPNARQDSALGVRVPPQTGPTWLAVLQDAEDLLEGRKLIPFWRVRRGAGLNLRRMFEDPAPVDPVGWLQGLAFLPYIEEGERVSPASWREFERMLRGDAALFAVWLN